MSHYLAIDLGASSGRVLLGRWDGGRFEVSERHRFGNGPVTVMGHLHWDVLRIWSEIKDGIARFGADHGARLDGIGLDTWGVDFALLDRGGRLLANPHHYRDRRTDGIPELVYRTVPREAIYAATGIQSLQINTLFQLYSMVRAEDPQLADAQMLLPLPNLFYRWLGADPVAEYTHATTTQCLDVRHRRWATELLAKLGIRTDLFPPLVEPATILGTLRRDVAEEAGLHGPSSVIAVGSHDTASAVAATPGLDRTSAWISSGTWSVMGVEAPAPIVDERAFAAGFTNEGGVGGTTRLSRNIAGLWLVQECRRQWQREGLDFGWAELMDHARAAAPFGPLVDPDAPEFLNPPDMPAQIRSFCLATGQGPPDGVGATVRCCLESLALRYRATLGRLEEIVEHRLDTIRIVGGGSQNGLLCQLAADACGVPVVAGPVEATALGNLMVQAIAHGEIDDVQAGREAVAGSVRLDTYEPRTSDAWAEGLARLRLPDAMGRP